MKEGNVAEGLSSKKCNLTNIVTCASGDDIVKGMSDDDVSAAPSEATNDPTIKACL